MKSEKRTECDRSAGITDTKARMKKETKTDFRVLLTSDIHCTKLKSWYGVSNDDRMQAWVEAVNAEHKLQPFDLILILGDLSLDFWINGGNHIKDGSSTARVLVDDYISRLPAGVPVFILAGNHEQYSEKDWESITGNKRCGTISAGDNVFIMLDSFSADLNPDTDADGTYVNQDMSYIRQQLDKYEGRHIYLCSHYFDYEKESEEFKGTVADNNDIAGLFAGHTHFCSVIDLGEEYGHKTIAQTGNFSYTNGADVKTTFWGFRELVITQDHAVSRYIIPDSNAVINGEQTHIDRTVTETVEYY